MNGTLNITNETDFIGAIVYCSGNCNYIEDVVVSVDTFEDKVRLNLSNGYLIFTNLNVKD